MFILLSYLIFYLACLTLSLADTHGIAKYARTYIRDTHTHAHTHTTSRKIRKKLVEKTKKKRGDQERKKEEKKKGRKEKGRKDGEK